MADNIWFEYTTKNEDNTIKRINMNIPADITLTKLFAYFVDFTRMIGYYPESWERTINEFAEEIDKDFNAFEMANAIMYE